MKVQTALSLVFALVTHAAGQQPDCRCVSGFLVSCGVVRNCLRCCSGPCCPGQVDAGWLRGLEGCCHRLDGQTSRQHSYILLCNLQLLADASCIPLITSSIPSHSQDTTSPLHRKTCRRRIPRSQEPSPPLTWSPDPRTAVLAKPLRVVQVQERARRQWQAD